MSDLRVILVDPMPALCSAWRTHLDGLPNVEVVEGRFEELAKFDCVATAGNSFGLMDGGVDAAVARFFGDALVRRVHRRILDEFLGEQPVGTSMIVETENAQHPFIAHTPTMRVPMTIARTDYVYCAMWAVLVAVHRYNKTAAPPIHVLACPGFGTGAGKVPLQEAARQMAAAYRHYLQPPRGLGWDFATQRQAAVRWGGDMGFLSAGSRPVAEPRAQSQPDEAADDSNPNP